MSTKLTDLAPDVQGKAQLATEQLTAAGIPFAVTSTGNPVWPNHMDPRWQQYIRHKASRGEGTGRASPTSRTTRW